MKQFLVATVMTCSAVSSALAGPAFVCTMTNNLDSGDKLELTFTITDAATGKGMVIGNAGTADLSVTRGAFSMNFFEFTDVGNVMLATVAIPSELPTTSTTSVKYPLVYSRHTVMSVPMANGTMGGEIVPSQYRGACIFKN